MRVLASLDSTPCLADRIAELRRLCRMAPLVAAYEAPAIIDALEAEVRTARMEIARLRRGRARAISVTRPTVVSTVLVALACPAFAQTPTPAPACFAVISPTAIATVSRPTTVINRDAGGSVPEPGNTTRWLFADTLATTPPQQGVILSNTSAIANLTVNPYIVTDFLDGNGVPIQAIPFTAAELAYNQTQAPERFAVWVGEGFTDETGNTIAPYFSLRLNGSGTMLEYYGVGIATFAPSAAQATRSEFLFGPTELGFFQSPLVHNGYLYLYATLQNPGPFAGFAVYVARAPYAAGAWRQRANYTFWNNETATWTADMINLPPMIPALQGSGVTVKFNQYLGRFLMGWSVVFANQSNFKEGAQPEGQWSETVSGFPMEPSGGLGSYATALHKEMFSQNDQRIIASYVQPTGGLNATMWVAQMDLGPSSPACPTATPTFAATCAASEGGPSCVGGIACNKTVTPTPSQTPSPTSTPTPSPTP